MEPETLEPSNIEDANTWLQENCRIENWKRELDREQALYFRHISVFMNVETGELAYKQIILDQQIPLELFYIRAAKLMYRAKEANAAIKEMGL